MSDKKLWDHHQNENRNHLIQWYQRQDKLFKYLRRFLDLWKNILEIGFWDWYLLNTLSNAWYNVIGQDLSENNIEITKKQWNNKKIKFLLWDDSWKLCVEDSSMDWFIASEVLEHMSDEELNICIKEIYRVLKKWWHAFITFPAKENLKNNECICPKCWEVFHKWWHKQYWDDNKIKLIFSEFKIVLTKEFFNRYTWNNFIEKVAWFSMYFIRKLINTMVDLDWKNYLVILKK